LYIFFTIPSPSSLGLAYSSSTCCWPWPLAVSSTWPRLTHRKAAEKTGTQIHRHRSDDYQNASGNVGGPKSHLDATKTCLAFNCKLTNRAGVRHGNGCIAALCNIEKQSSNKTAKTMCTSFPTFPLHFPPPAAD